MRSDRPLCDVFSFVGAGTDLLPRRLALVMWVLAGADLSIEVKP
jgi:hypothetical protein